MVAVIWVLFAASVGSTLSQESPDVFLAKATLQQYLSRVVRKDWNGARQFTHPKTLRVIEQTDKRTRVEVHGLAPWANPELQLKTFQFIGAREVSPGIILVQVGEDTYRTEQQALSVDDPAVYVLFRSRGGFLVGDKKAGAALTDVSDSSVRIGYPGYLDNPAPSQARREPGRHR
jgi:hypothetical protein